MEQFSFWIMILVMIAFLLLPIYVIKKVIEWIKK